MGIYSRGMGSDSLQIVMWGALIFMLFFLVIGPTTRAIILDFIEQTRLRFAVSAPLSYFLVVIIAGSALVSALIMTWWPKVEVETPVYRVTRHYLGPADDDVRRAPATLGPWLQLALALARCVLSVRMAASLEVRLRDLAASTALKRQLGA